MASFNSPDTQLVWDNIRDHDGTLIRPQPPSVRIDLPNVDQLSEITQFSRQFLPIERFRRDARDLFRGDGEPTVRFISSGTTSSERASSIYSDDGCDLYRITSVMAFHSMLSKIFGNDVVRVRGVSMIPPALEAPDSSLAQMATWLSDFWPITFTTKDDLLNVVKKMVGGRPIFIFGTAIQYLQIADEGMRVRIPAGSICIETGGFKGVHREVTREELYSLMSFMFRIPESAIVSEYGMSELACQAYDWISPLEYGNYSFENRIFVMPPWVQIAAYDGFGRFKSRGIGALSVYDPARIDFPWIIRTQDIAEILSDKTFRLMGRVPASPLKGCSITFDASSVIEPVTYAVVRGNISHAQFNYALTRQRIAKHWRAIHDFLDADTTRAMLGDEVGSQSAARVAIRQLIDTLPRDENSIIDAVKCAIGADAVLSNAPQRIIIIAPTNHSIAVLYPLVLGVFAGIEMYIRLPLGKAGNLIRAFVDQLKLPVEILEPSFRIGKSALPSEDCGFLCYGTTETLKSLRQHLTQPVKGFGHVITLSIIKADEFDEVHVALIEDSFSLAQRGCLSIRSVLVTNCGDRKFDNWGYKLNTAAQKVWGEIHQLPNQLAIDQARIGLELSGWQFFTVLKRGMPLFPYRWSAQSSGDPLVVLDSVVCPTAFVLPFYIMRSSIGSSFLQALKLNVSSDHLHLVVSNSTAAELCVTENIGAGQQIHSWATLGQGGQPPWNGKHIGSPLFVF